MLTGIEKLEAEADINAMVRLYGEAVDLGPVETYVACFTPDGSFTTSAGKATVGHEALRANKEKSHGPIERRHLFTAPIIEFTSPDTANGRGFCLILEHNTETKTTGAPFTVDYKDTYRKTDKGWLLQTRAVLRSF